MPRQARIDYPGALHHVIGRGIERKYIFRSDKDKEDFLHRFREVLDKSHAECFAWCIMGNHFHILLQTGQTGLSEIMRRVLTGYASYFNRRYKRVGHLFQNRYKSVLCDKEEYFLPLIRYIHLNPVRARILEYDKLKNYKWSGHNDILKKRKENIIERDEVLLHFGQTEQEARKAYLRYVKEGIGLKENLSGGGLIRSAGGMRSVLKMRRGKEEREQYDERILGCGQFVSDALKHAEIEGQENLKIKRSLGTIDSLLEKLGTYYDIEKEGILFTRVKSVVNAKRLFIYFGNQYFGKSLTEMGNMLGISQQAASYSYKKGKELEKVENISKVIF